MAYIGSPRLKLDRKEPSAAVLCAGFAMSLVVGFVAVSTLFAILGLPVM